MSLTKSLTQSLILSFALDGVRQVGMVSPYTYVAYWNIVFCDTWVAYVATFRAQKTA